MDVAVGWGHTFNGYNVKSIGKNMDAVLRQEPCSIIWLIIYMMANPRFGSALSTTAKNMKEIKAALAKIPDPTAMKLLRTFR